MNKKINTVLFILGASILNVILMILFMTLGLALISLIIPDNISPTLASALFIMVFLLSVGGSFLAYHKGIKLLAKKIDMDKYFHPIFKSIKR
ncbi:MAG: leader peptide processing enzyme [Spirochaetota bacterium]|nr:leader peptide processing enzyme [Spirochaetota bacterium]